MLLSRAAHLNRINQIKSEISALPEIKGNLRKNIGSLKSIGTFKKVNKIGKKKLKTNKC